MKTIAFLSNKGGVGKSTSASTVASCIAKKGYKVLVIDLDPQGNTSNLYSKINVLNYLENILQGKTQVLGKSVEDLLLNPSENIHNCIQSTDFKNVELIPAYLTLSEAEERIKADIRNPQQFRLKNHLQKINKEYDYCIIDCAPSVSITNINGLAACNEVYVPMRADAWSVLGMCITKNLIQTVQQYSPDLKFEACYFTQWDNKRKSFNKQIYGLVKEQIPELLPIRIGLTRLVDKTTYEQMPLPEYDNGKRKSKVTEQYELLTEYILSNDRKQFREKLNYLEDEFQEE